MMFGDSPGEHSFYGSVHIRAVVDGALSYGLPKLVVTVVLQMFTPADETHKTYDVVLIENFPEVS